MCASSLKTLKRLFVQAERMQEERVLNDMFPSLDREVVSNVFVQCNQDLDSSINVLLEMTSSSSTPQRPSNINQYGFHIRDDSDDAVPNVGASKEKKQEYVNASFWGGTNTYSYDAPSYRGEAKPGNTNQEAEEMDRILEFMERKFGNEQKQTEVAKKEDPKQSEKVTAEKDALNSEKQKPEVKTASMNTNAKTEEEDGFFLWRCGDCKYLNSMKRFSCEDCFSLRDMVGEKVKVDKKEAEAKEPKRPTPSLNLSGKYVFKEGKYVYVTEEEEKKEGEPLNSKYSFTRENNNEEQKKEKEEAKPSSEKEEAKQTEEKKEEGTPRLSFGKYVFIGGKYVYVREGEKVPEDVQPEDSYIRKKAQEQKPAQSSFHPYLTVHNNTLTEEAKVTWMCNCKNYYQLLGVAKDSSLIEIKASYKKLALWLHPDRNSTKGSDEAFKAVSEAFNCLSNPETRKTYDLFGSTTISQEEMLKAFFFLRSMFNPFNAAAAGRQY